MESLIAKSLNLRYEPVAVLFTYQRPQGAAQFKEKRWGCVMSMLRVAARGYTAVFDRKTIACMGGQVGLCFGDSYKGHDVERFLSTGSPGKQEGLGFFKSPELARDFVDMLPREDIPEPYVVLKPLRKVNFKEESPRVIVFMGNGDQISALTVLANYDRPGGDAVMVPFASGCQTICLLPYVESQRKHPKAVLGGMDIQARPHLDPDILTFAVPYVLYERMEANVPGSFLEKGTWAKMWTRNKEEEPPEAVEG
ncbi:MAG: DUF169 domain-containing protein [Acidobacteriota bacterium]